MNQEAVLIVVRHGVARMPDIGENDFSRTLTFEGVAGVEQVAEWLANKVGLCSAVVTSPAARARQTSDILARRLLRSGVAVTVKDGIYDAPRQTLVELMQGFNYSGPAVLVGHNPGLEDLANYLLDGRDASTVQLSPGQALCMRLMVAWPGAGRGTARLVAQISPGDLAGYGR